MTTTSFSLIDEAWISCALLDGSTQLCSLRDVFSGRQDIVGIRGDSPTQDYATVRVLLAITLRAHRATLDLSPSGDFDFAEWADEAWKSTSSGHADDAVLEYLEKWRDRFDLFSASTPFMQVADLRTPSGSELSVTRIIPEAEGSYFTMRTGPGASSLTPAEAARWVIHTQAYDYSGIKPGAVGDSRVKGGKGYPIGTGWAGMTGGTLLLGSTLRKTLILNTTSDALFGNDLDLPAWERHSDTAEERENSWPQGVADILTWQSRRIRLIHSDATVTGVLVCNGDRIPDAGANIMIDPMTPYRFSSNKSSKTLDVYYPRPYDTYRTMWRSLEPLLALSGDVPLAKGLKPSRRPATLDEFARTHAKRLTGEDRLLNIRLTSASYGAQASSASTTVDSQIAVPTELLGEEGTEQRMRLLDAAQRTQEASIQLGRFGGSLLQAAGGDYQFVADLTDSVLGDLQPSFIRWVRTLSEDSAESHIENWQRHVLHTVLLRAREATRGAGPKALIGRDVTHNDRTTFLSAGTAFRQLESRLRDVLPLARAESESITTQNEEVVA